MRIHKFEFSEQTNDENIARNVRNAAFSIATGLFAFTRSIITRLFTSKNAVHQQPEIIYILIKSEETARLTASGALPMQIRTAW